MPGTSWLQAGRFGSSTRTTIFRRSSSQFPHVPDPRSRFKIDEDAFEATQASRWARKCGNEPPSPPDPPGKRASGSPVTARRSRNQTAESEPDGRHDSRIPEAAREASLPHDHRPPAGPSEVAADGMAEEPVTIGEGFWNVQDCMERAKNVRNFGPPAIRWEFHSNGYVFGG